MSDVLKVSTRTDNTADNDVEVARRIVAFSVPYNKGFEIAFVNLLFKLLLFN